MRLIQGYRHLFLPSRAGVVEHCMSSWRRLETIRGATWSVLLALPTRPPPPPPAQAEASYRIVCCTRWRQQRHQATTVVYVAGSFSVPLCALCFFRSLYLSSPSWVAAALLYYCVCLRQGEGDTGKRWGHSTVWYGCLLAAVAAAATAVLCSVLVGIVTFTCHSSTGK